MKIAVLSDIHANFPALQAVIADIENWKPDWVIQAGDIVNRGPSPRQCLALLHEKEQQAGWRSVRGNHEEYVIHVSQPGFARQGPAFEVHRPSFWTFQQLGEDVVALQAMPLTQTLSAPDGSGVRVTHASMRGMRDGIYPETGDDELRTQIGQPPSLFVVGHTHRPLVRQVDDTLVVNTGSAGLPFDGDWRPSYARIERRSDGWRAEIARVTYDRARAEQDFFDSGYWENGGPIIRMVLAELRTASSMLYSWAVRYQDQAALGQISVKESVDRFLGYESA